jgi:hypothetical protein
MGDGFAKFFPHGAVGLWVPALNEIALTISLEVGGP